MEAVTELEQEGAVDEGHATQRVLDDRTDGAQMAWEREKEAAFAADASCAHCGEPVTEPRDAAYFPDLRRLAHRGDCAVEVMRARWGHLPLGVVVGQAAA